MSILTLKESMSNYPKIYTRDNKFTMRIDMGTIIDEYPDGRGVVYWSYPDEHKLYLLDSTVEDNRYLVFVLTRNELVDSGYYKVQGEWFNDDMVVKDSHIYKVYVSKSLASTQSDDTQEEIILQPELIDQLMTLREEISSAHQDITSREEHIVSLSEQIETTANQVHSDAQINLHPPVIGGNGNWMIWSNDTNQYVDTGSPAAGGVYTGSEEPANPCYSIWVDTSDEEEEQEDEQDVEQ